MPIQRSDKVIPKKNYLGQVNESFIVKELANSGIPSELTTSLGRAFDRILRRLAVDERLNYEVIESGLRAGRSVIFHQPGAVALSPSNVAPWHPPKTESFLIISSLQVAGSGSTVISFYKNGAAAFDTITLAASDVYETKTISQSFNGTTDEFTAKVTTAGAAAEELLVEVIPQ